MGSIKGFGMIYTREKRQEVLLANIDKTEDYSGNYYNLATYINHKYK